MDHERLSEGTMKRQIFVGFLTIFALVAGVLAQAPEHVLNLPQDRVLRVIDGDTVELERIGRARLIGVDTPETGHSQKPVEAFGKEAADFTRRQLEGKTVHVDTDVDKVDRYGRALVYLYLHGTFFNAELIKQGYAHAYTQFPSRYLEEFRQYEREARAAGKGLWGADVEAQEEGLSDAEIRRILIQQSIASYRGSCPCPYSIDRAGRRCGGRSAYSPPGGASPLCYESDVTDAMVEE